jgi:hypothetical protein
MLQAKTYGGYRDAVILQTRQFRFVEFCMDALKTLTPFGAITSYESSSNGHAGHSHFRVISTPSCWAEPTRRRNGSASSYRHTYHARRRMFRANVREDRQMLALSALNPAV